jgi:hypothetical protein
MNKYAMIWALMAVATACAGGGKTVPDEFEARGPEESCFKSFRELMRFKNDWGKASVTLPEPHDTEFCDAQVDAGRLKAPKYDSSCGQWTYGEFSPQYKKMVLGSFGGPDTPGPKSFDPQLFLPEIYRLAQEDFFTQYRKRCIESWKHTSDL